MRDLPIVKVYKPTDVIRLLILSMWDPLQLQTTLKQKQWLQALSKYNSLKALKACDTHNPH